MVIVSEIDLFPRLKKTLIFASLFSISFVLAALSSHRRISSGMELLGRAKEIAGPIVERIWNFEERRQTLKRKLQELESIEADINCELKIEESLSGKKRKNEVENWLVNVGRIKKEVESIEQKVKESRWNGLLGESVEKMTKEVMELIEKSRFQSDVVFDVPETGEDLLLTTKLVGQAFQMNRDKILECLMKDEVLSIGIYGMGGVGKTTIVTHIHNQLLESENKFRHVYWISVSQDCTIYKLQNLIAKTIHLDLSNEDDEKKRAAKVSKALILKKNCVLFLDDLWNHFHLEKVGIPVGMNGCRLILTTRSLDVCLRMGCQESIKVETLSEEEAWDLFKEKIGKLPPPEVNQIAKAIARECAGLPLGIVTMAGSMRGVDDVHEWRNALMELEESKVRQGDMEFEVFRILKFSYNRLMDSALQQCFLFCALYPEDHLIDRKVLIECLIVEGVTEGGSRQAELDEGHTMLNRLEKASLLESVMELGCRYVKMHDLIRDMAIQIMKVKPPVMVKAGKQLTEMPDWGNWNENLVRISLMNNCIEEIPFGYSPRCPNLSTLLLSGNEQLRSIADSFFEQLHGLKVLDLSGTGIVELPNSVSNLVNLNALLLKFCYNLRHVPSVAKLRALRKLDLNMSGVEEVPQGIELLFNLTYLGLNRTKLKELPPGILPKLYNLQVLLLDPSLIVKGEEVASLRKLETLNCRFHDVGKLDLRSLKERLEHSSMN